MKSALLLTLLAGLSALMHPVCPLLPDGWYSLSTHPTAFPALAYGAIDLLFGAVGVEELEPKLYVVVLLNHGLVLGAAVALLAMGSLVDAERSMSVAAVLYLLVMLSTLAPHTALSESFLVFANAWALYCIVNAYICLGNGEDGAETSAVGAGVLLGLGVGITPTVIVVLPAALALVAVACPGSRAPLRRRSFVATWMVASLLFTVGGSFATDLARHGRLDPARSVGGHLWNVVRLDAESLLAGEPGYELLKANIAFPAPESIEAHDLRRTMQTSTAEALRAWSKDDEVFDAFLKEMAFSAILSHPSAFARVGMRQFSQNLLLPPPAIGRATLRTGISGDLLVDHRLNPLWRDRWLPARISSYGPIAVRVLEVVGLLVTVLFPLGLLVAWIGGVAVCAGLSFTGAPGDDRNLEWVTRMLPLQAFFLWAFLSNRYALGQLETFGGRYVVVLLVALFAYGAMVAASARVLADRDVPSRAES